MGQEEEEQFFHQAQAFLLLHCQLACTASPLSSAQEIQQVLLSHQHYCNQQRKNDKTRRVLEKSFGAEWADRYINTMLFDPIVL
jgi:phycocyanobilin:ferredoxin oxidoreductase